MPPLPPGLYRTSADATLDGDCSSRTDTGRNSPATFHAGAPREADPTFTAWVGQTLHEVYDPVSHEPLPQDLARLVRMLERIPPVGRQ